MSTSELDLASPLPLPCGVTLPNRIAKAAMTEGLADRYGRATEAHKRLYRHWAEGGTGMLLTGNIQVDHRSLERPGNIRIEGHLDADGMRALRELATTGRSGGAHIWAQLSHAGRQASSSACPEPVAPSPVALPDLPPPRELTEEEIVDIIARFGSAARVCREAGFNGVQLHGAHGYLVSQFLSPATNRRTDDWGGDIESRSRFLLEVIRSMRKEVGTDFPIGLKLNSADFQAEGFTHEESLSVIKMLNDEQLDLLEVTGGTYEQVSMLGADSDTSDTQEARASTVAREAYFAKYSADAREVATMPVMCTGGFRVRQSMIDALRNGVCDLVGLGRPLVTDPAISRKLLAGEVDQTDVFESEWRFRDDTEAGMSDPELKEARVLGSLAQYYCILFEIGDGKHPDRSRSLDDAQEMLRLREDAIADEIRELYGLAPRDLAVRGEGSSIFTSEPHPAYRRS